jgi:hypothetical protein
LPDPLNRELEQVGNRRRGVTYRHLSFYVIPAFDTRSHDHPGNVHLLICISAMILAYTAMIRQNEDVITVGGALKIVRNHSEFVFGIISILT